MSAQVKENHAEQQAKAQLESIVEMVAGLTREGAAANYAAELSYQQCVDLLTENDIDYDKDNDTEEALREQVAEFIADETIISPDFEFDEDEARDAIQEDPLSVEVRSDWYTPGSEDNEPAEFCILLCTGGPAVRIIGDLDRGQPDNPRIEYQDWGTPWTQYFPESEQREALQTYCEQFYFGE